MKTLIRARYVIASDGQSHHILENGEVVYEGDTILSVSYTHLTLPTKRIV